MKVYSMYRKLGKDMSLRLAATWTADCTSAILAKSGLSIR